MILIRQYAPIVAWISGAMTVWLLTCELTAHAHNGRGFEIEVVAGKLQAQGINPADPDGAPAVRPYLNSIHDHWRYVPSLDSSVASLPEFEVGPQVAFAFLDSYSLDLELVSASKWEAPPLMPVPGTVPALIPIESGEHIAIQTLGAPITTETLGTLALSSAIPADGTGDIVPLYSIGGDPKESIYVLQFILSATGPNGSSPGIAPSDSVFVLLSPDGMGPEERLHQASLYLEEYLGLNGLPVPEPSSQAMLWMAITMILARRANF